MKVAIFILILIFTSATTTLVFHKTQTADINYYKAHRYFEKGKYDKAIPLYKKALSIKKSSHQDALKELGFPYQWTGSYKDAMEKMIDIFGQTVYTYI